MSIIPDVPELCCYRGNIKAVAALNRFYIKVLVIVRDGFFVVNIMVSNVRLHFGYCDLVLIIILGM